MLFNVKFLFHFSVAAKCNCIPSEFLLVYLNLAWISWKNNYTDIYPTRICHSNHINNGYWFTWSWTWEHQQKFFQHLDEPLDYSSKKIPGRVTRSLQFFESKELSSSVLFGKKKIFLFEPKKIVTLSYTYLHNLNVLTVNSSLKNKQTTT